MRFITFIVLVAITLVLIIGTGTVHAFNDAEPGWVIDSLHIDDEDLGTYSGYDCQYAGQQNDGDYVVIVSYNDWTKSTNRIQTYEVSESGTIIGLIDSGTLSDTSRVLIRQYDSFNDQETHGDWYFAVCKNKIDSLQITQEGEISPVCSTNSSSSLNVEAVRVYDNLILVADQNEDLSTYYMDSEHTLARSDIEDLPDAGGVPNSITLTDYGSYADRTYFLVGTADNDYWQSGYISGEPGVYPANSIILSGSTAISGDIFGGVTADLEQIHSGYALMIGRGYYGGPPGLSGDVDIIAHTIYGAPGSGNQVKIDTAYVEDQIADTYSEAWAILPFPPSHAALYYNNDNKLAMRVIWGLTDSGSLTQGQITQRLEIDTGESRQRDHPHWVTRLGDSNLSAVLWSPLLPDGSQDLITIAHNLIPTVETADIGFFQDTSCTAYGEVTSIGSDTVTEWGFVYDTSGDPDYSGSRSACFGHYAGTPTMESPGDFHWDITGLVHAQRYYIRAYACNSSGTAYGDTLTTYTIPGYGDTIIDLQFEPDQISSGTISDQSGCGNDVSYTWLANPGSLTIEYTPVDTRGWYYSGTKAELLLIQDDAESTTYNMPTERTFTGLPGMDMINTQLDNADIPQAFFWLPFLTAMIVLIGFAFYFLAKDVIAMAAGCGLGIVLCTTFGWFPWWYIPAYLIPAYAVVIGQRASGGQHI